MIVRLFAWLTTIFTIVFLFLGGRWVFDTLVIPVVVFIFEMEGFIRVFEIILSILFILFLLFLGKFLIHWITEVFHYKNIPHWIAYVGSVVCLLFLVYVSFAPYFYTHTYLEKVGTERIHDLSVLTDDSLTKKERIEKSKKSMTMGEALQNGTEHSEFPLENMKILSIESGEIERSYNTFTYVARIELENRNGREVSS